LIPKDDHIWIFGAWDGQKYSDNPKWLYEYVNTRLPDVRAIWLSKNKAVIEKLKQGGLEAYYTYSLKGYRHSARAKIGVVCIGIEDINRFVLPPVLINTWHGTPIKKVGKEVELFRAKTENTSTKALTDSIRMIWFKLLPFFDPPSKDKRYSLYIAGSRIEADLLRKSFGNINVKVTGLPRNDVLCGTFDIAIAEKSNTKHVLYLPTHRFEGKQRIMPRIADGIEKVECVLGEVNAKLVIKLHAFNQYEADALSEVVYGLHNIAILPDNETLGDIYPLLKSADILITDYSSVYVDYLVTEKPIIFFPFGLDQYLSKERAFNFYYMSMTPGPKCWDWESVALWIKRFCEDPSLYLEERVRLKSFFHAFDDGRNCERVVEAIEEIQAEKRMGDVSAVYHAADCGNLVRPRRCREIWKPMHK